ncbi:hypothetical protein QYM36_009299 [Artemia franciscana]|uniref:Uncharacterized protein n=1 Tax=Artemia franciscana TaxID=6661 RepID=A0AA88L592_ARTSF|nr:hypothetical protein QYM36_009299 [Artemia franciscana]
MHRQLTHHIVEAFKNSKAIMMRLGSSIDQNMIIRCTECKSVSCSSEVTTLLESYVRDEVGVIKYNPKNSILFYGIIRNNTSVIKYFLVNGTDPCIKDSYGRTALHITAKGNPDICQILVPYEAEANYYEAEASGNSTHLRLAAFCDIRCMMIDFLKKGADHSFNDWFGKTALHYAAEKGNLDICQILVSYGAKVNCLTSKKLTPLHLATLHNEICVAKYLLKNGADHSLKDRFGKTALHYAAEEGNLDVCQVLVSYGAKVNCINYEKMTPLHFATLYNETCVAKHLLKNGADHSLKDRFGKTALHYAAEEGNLDICQILVSYGAQVNCLTSKKLTPLHLATFSNETCVAKYLLKNGADYSLRDRFGKTALHYAAEKGNLDILEYFLENKAVYHPIITRDEYERILRIFVQDPFLDEARKKIWFCRFYYFVFKESITLKSISRKVIRKHIDLANKFNDKSERFQLSAFFAFIDFVAAFDSRVRTKTLEDHGGKRCPNRTDRALKHHGDRDIQGIL